MYIKHTTILKLMIFTELSGGSSLCQCVKKAHHGIVQISNFIEARLLAHPKIKTCKFHVFKLPSDYICNDISQI